MCCFKGHVSPCTATAIVALQVLVELAQERDEDIPALVYEARSTGQPRCIHRPRQQRQQHLQPQRQQQRNLSEQAGSLQQQRHDSAALREVTVAQAGSSSPQSRLQASTTATARPVPKWDTGGSLMQKQVRTCFQHLCSTISILAKCSAMMLMLHCSAAFSFSPGIAVSGVWHSG